MTTASDKADYPRAPFGGTLKIADLEIPCFVLQDGTRVVTQRGLQKGIGMSASGGTSGAHRMARFVASLAGKGLDSKDLGVRTNKPILFYQITRGHRLAYGYEATILADLCEFVLNARDAQLLTKQQAQIGRAHV